MPHFDVEALLAAVLSQDHGLHVSTNDPDGFKRILYKSMRAQPALRCHIYSSRASKRRFILLKARLASTTALEELPDGEG